ncbi:MAG: STAS domain-containing protein [Bacteroidales bacterium]|nr:STAS domain-containing protein [Bacteroidales bacterium]
MIKYCKKDAAVTIFFKDEHILNEMNSVLLEKKILKLVKSKPVEIRISFEGISFIDSNGFRLLLRINENLKFEGIYIILTNLSGDLLELFSLLKLDNKFRFDQNAKFDNGFAA